MRLKWETGTILNSTFSIVTEFRTSLFVLTCLGSMTIDDYWFTIPLDAGLTMGRRSISSVYCKSIYRLHKAIGGIPRERLPTEVDLPCNASDSDSASKLTLRRTS